MANQLPVTTLAGRSNRSPQGSLDGWNRNVVTAEGSTRYCCRRSSTANRVVSHGGLL
jgi:hypothetical protein